MKIKTSAEPEEQIKEIHRLGIGREPYAKDVPTGPVIKGYASTLFWATNETMGSSSGWRYSTMTCIVKEAMGIPVERLPHSFGWSGYDSLPR